jgi:hypothetical protein
LPYPEIRTSHQVRELVLQLLDGILAKVAYDNVDIMIARMPDYGARERGSVVIDALMRCGGSRKRL